MFIMEIEIQMNCQLKIVRKLSVRIFNIKIQNA